MLCTSLLALIAVVLLTGWACDKGLPVCWAGGAFSLAGAALPFALCEVAGRYAPGSGPVALAPVWVLQILLMAWTAVPLALLPTVGVNIYTTSVRASGYCLGCARPRGARGLCWICTRQLDFAACCLRTSVCSVLSLEALMG